eukprot:m.34694 g.34694  ORF g.34694 m.34694 type:complete len:867 (+) comp8764_c0_seq1:99-2699(+)
MLQAPQRRQSDNAAGAETQKAASSLPTVFGEEFKNAGQKEGIEIWRIEKLKCVKKENAESPKDTPPNCGQLAHKGKFCQGDSYIILSTKKKSSGAWDRKIFYWRGEDSSQDEYGTMAYKTVELDESLGGEPSQHMEMQGHETGMFKALFKSGVSYIKGGVATGFRDVKKLQVHKNRLLHVKGRRNVTVRQVECHNNSMNEGDVFILDCGEKLYQYNGKLASRVEKQKAMEAVRNIRDEERSGKAQIMIIDQDSAETSDLENQFWADMGVPVRPNKLNSATDDSEHEAKAKADVKLYHISDASGIVKVDEVPTRPLNKALLDSNDTYLLTAGSAGVYSWVGKGATRDEKLAAVKHAQKFVKDNKLPEWTPISRVVEGGETPMFKSFFSVWPTQKANTSGGASKFQKKEFDASTLHSDASEPEKPQLPLELEGSGSVEVFRIENLKDLVPVDKAQHGQFYGGDSYVICYKYKNPAGRDEAFIYFWQGLKSSQDEKAASAIQAKDMDDKMGGYPIQVRVVQNKEPEHFFKIFRGVMVVHAGGKASGFKNSDEKDSYDTDGTRLFHVRGTNNYNTRAVQVEERAASLNSDDVFILETKEQLYVWHGKGAGDDEQAFAKRIAPKLHGLKSKVNDPLVVKEGSEPKEFWQALGADGKTRPEYGTIDYKQEAARVERREPRLFHCSDARGYFWAEEMFDFDQEDLVEEDCMVLDTWAEVYVWVGDKAKDSEKEGAMAMAKKYVESAPDRSVDDTTFLVIKQGREPLPFTANFIGWDDAKWRNGKTYEQLKAELMSGDLTVDMSNEMNKGSQTYSYEDLSAADWQTRCPGVNSLTKEQNLSDEEFQNVFKMTKDEYKQMPAWKANNLKKAAKLF